MKCIYQNENSLGINFFNLPSNLQKHYNYVSEVELKLKVHILGALKFVNLVEIGAQFVMIFLMTMMHL